MKLIDKDALAAEIERLKNEALQKKNQCKRSGLQKIVRQIGAYNKVLSLIESLEVKEVPIWEKVSPDTGQTTLYKDGDESYLERFGYRIDLKELDKLPKKNSTHRTPADIEAAMQEVEAKSEAYTNAHRGERDDDVLSQMRGETVSEDLEEAAKEYAIEQVLCSTDTRMTEQAYLGIRLFNGYDLACAYKDGAENQREQMMKGAIDGICISNGAECGSSIESSAGMLFLQHNTFDVGDKVKIVIVKNE